MAHKVLPTPSPKEQPVKTVYKSISKGLYSIKTKITPFTEALVLLTIAGWYFFFTGLALCLGRTLPKDWLKIATRLTGDRIAKKIDGKEVVQKPNSYKVVDLESKETIPVMV